MDGKKPRIFSWWLQLLAGIAICLLLAIAHGNNMYQRGWNDRTRAQKLIAKQTDEEFSREMKLLQETLATLPQDSTDVEETVILIDATKDGMLSDGERIKIYPPASGDGIPTSK